MANPGFWAANVGLALLALGLGGHWLDWAYRDLADVADRVEAWTLAAQVYVGASLGALAVTLCPAPYAPSVQTTRVAWFAICAGLILFAAPLFIYALTGQTFAMVALLPGILGLSLGWLILAAKLVVAHRRRL